MRVDATIKYSESGDNSVGEEVLLGNQEGCKPLKGSTNYPRGLVLGCMPGVDPLLSPGPNVPHFLL